MITNATKEKISDRDVRRAIKRIGITGVLTVLKVYCQDMASGRTNEDPIRKHYGELGDILFDATLAFREKCEKFDAKPTDCACGGTGVVPSIDPDDEDGYKPCPDCDAGRKAKERGPQ